MATPANDARLRENEKIAATINRVWGARVAWVEERFFDYPATATKPALRMTIPVVVSSLVCGCLPGRACPPFFAGPVPNGGR